MFLRLLQTNPDKTLTNRAGLKKCHLTNSLKLQTSIKMTITNTNNVSAFFVFFPQFV